MTLLEWVRWIAVVFAWAFVVATLSVVGVFFFMTIVRGLFPEGLTLRALREKLPWSARRGEVPTKPPFERRVTCLACGEVQRLRCSGCGSARITR